MTRPPILDQVAVLCDPTRARILLVLERHELTVGEICEVLVLPQSTVSRHLKHLLDQGWLGVRHEGTRRFYRLDLDGVSPTERRVWMLVQEGVAADPSSAHDLERLEAAMERRRERSKSFFEGAAEQWGELRRELFGSRFDLLALLALLESDLVVGDLGCGTGELAGTLAPYVGKVIGIDSSREMLASARRNLDSCGNVELRHGGLEHLPLENGELDVALLLLVLHHLPDPARVLGEVRRSLRPGGRLLVVDMLPHNDESLRESMGHVWMGFGRDDLAEQFQQAGLSLGAVRALPRGEGQGPQLFVATAFCSEGRIRALEQKRNTATVAAGRLAADLDATDEPELAEPEIF